MFGDRLGAVVSLASIRDEEIVAAWSKGGNLRSNSTVCVNPKKRHRVYWRRRIIR